jgi:hypothetical protein
MILLSYSSVCVLSLTVVLRECVLRGRECGGGDGECGDKVTVLLRGDKVTVLLRGRECGGGDGESGDKAS